eukprot:1396446-Pleurochrysis_carterae.AAC.1
MLLNTSFTLLPLHMLAFLCILASHVKKVHRPSIDYQITFALTVDGFLRVMSLHRVFGNFLWTQCSWALLKVLLPSLLTIAVCTALFAIKNNPNSAKPLLKKYPRDVTN